MTIAISLKVNDGVVLAADSASTIIGQDPDGRLGVVNVYNNANKVFNLKKGFPIGAITWGSGSIGQESISTLTKDFREKLDITITDYTIEKVTKEFKDFIFDEKYDKEFKDWPEKPSLGFMIVGYSSDKPLAEEWKIDIVNGECEDPYRVRGQNEIGITWNGEIEAINRLYFGYGLKLQQFMKEVGIKDELIEKTIEKSREDLITNMVMPAMPIQDAIDLAEFLVETTAQFSRFIPGAPTVGGPVEIAAITKHEEFKWVKRKHYFDASVNPNSVIK